MGMSNDEIQDKFVQFVLIKMWLNYISFEVMMGDECSIWVKIVYVFQEVFGVIGVVIEVFVVGVVMMLFIMLMIMMQLLILMVIYMFLLLVVWFSGYDLCVLVYGVVGIFIVKFWLVMWFFVCWMDDYLIEVMFLDWNFFFDFFVNVGDNNYK